MFPYLLLGLFLPQLVHDGLPHRCAHLDAAHGAEYPCEHAQPCAGRAADGLAQCGTGGPCDRRGFGFPADVAGFSCKFVTSSNCAIIV